MSKIGGRQAVSLEDIDFSNGKQYTVRELADKLGVSHVAIYKKIKNGVISKDSIKKSDFRGRKPKDNLDQLEEGKLYTYKEAYRLLKKANYQVVRDMVYLGKLKEVTNDGVKYVYK